MPTNLNLEYYRKAAKSLLKAARSGDDTARERITRFFPDVTPALHHAQLTVAREQGFASWPRFRDFIVQSNLDFAGLVNQFVKYALDDAHRAEEMLARHPEIADAGLYPALVLCDAQRVERNYVDGAGGPRNWPPLLYVCFSRLRRGDAAACARFLLARGADPNGSYRDERWPEWPLSCLFGAAGAGNNVALARVLLEAGANPNDNESLYHSTEHPGLACTKLLLEFGASPHNPNTLNHMLDREDAEGVRLLLAAGADPNATNDRGETALHWAVGRGRSAEIVAALLDAGASIDARRGDGLTAYALAVQTDQPTIAQLLATRGASTEIGPEASVSLPDLVMNRHTSAVRALLAKGVDVNTRGDAGGTALHWACWKGYPDLVRLLLDHGASLTIEDDEYHAPPAGWFHHGSTNCTEGTGDYPQIARLLHAAGAFQESEVPTGNSDVDAVLRELGVIT